MQPNIIFITGCSTGIGYDAAIALSQRGHRVIASCRKEEDVKKLLAAGLEAVRMDMNDSASIADATEQVLHKTAGHLDVLINNAGYGQAGALEDIPRELLRAQFETNVFGLMDLTQLIIPVMRQQGYGRIINVSSILGLVSMPFRGAYSASKYAVEGLSDALRLELKPAGIHVISIVPGPIHSRFTDNVIDCTFNKIDHEHSHFKAQYKQMLSSFRQQKSQSMFTKGTDVVVQTLIHAIESPRPNPKYLVTLAAHVLAGLKRLLSIKMLDRTLTYVSGKRWNSELT